MSVRFETLDAEELLRAADWWALYEGSFPPAEREAPAVIVRSVEAGVGLAFRVQRHEATVGLATVHLLREPRVAFCVYLAVAGDQQGRGLGGELFRHVAASAKGRAMRGVVWEVEEPAAAGSETARHQRERRIVFFERQGGRRLDVTYFQPPLDGGPPVPMRLMFRPADDAEVIDVRALVRAIYSEKYGVINAIPVATLHRLLAATGNLLAGSPESA